MDILEKIDRMRKDRGWSMYMLALEAGITQSTLLNMYSRGTQPSVKTLTAICNAFGVSLSEYFADGDAANGATARERELIAAYRRLSDKEKRAVESLIKELGK